MMIGGGCVFGRAIYGISCLLCQDNLSSFPTKYLDLSTPFAACLKLTLWGGAVVYFIHFDFDACSWLDPSIYTGG